MADPNHIVLDEYRLAFIHPCKTANLAQKAALARSLGWSVKTLSAEDSGWDYRCAENIPREYLIVGTVRHPCERLVSAWFDRQPRLYVSGLHKWGFRQEWTAGQAIAHACQLPDESTNEHFRSLHYEFGPVEPDILIRFETLRKDWERTRFAVKKHSGLDLPRLEQRNGSKHGPWQYYYTPELLERVHERYSEDFRRWY